MVTLPTQKKVYATQGKDVLVNHNQRHVDNLMPCTHEESDTRIFVHVADAAAEGCNKIVI